MVDAGAGPGTLARAILAAEPACAARCGWCASSDRPPSAPRAATRRSPGADRRRIRPRTEPADLPERADVIIANELLDNLPFGLLERTDDGWVEVDVGRRRVDDARHRRDAASRSPTSAAAWVADARQSTPARRASRLLRLRRHHRRPGRRDPGPTGSGRSPITSSRPIRSSSPGSRDVTVVVPLDQLPPPTTTTTQADWLRRPRHRRARRRGTPSLGAHAAAPDLGACGCGAGSVEAEALVDPAGLGAFWVAEWSAGSA